MAALHGRETMLVAIVSAANLFMGYLDVSDIILTTIVGKQVARTSVLSSRSWSCDEDQETEYEQ